MRMHKRYMQGDFIVKNELPDIFPEVFPKNSQSVSEVESQTSELSETTSLITLKELIDDYEDTSNEWLMNLAVECAELTNDNLLLTNPGLLGEGEWFPITRADDYEDGILSPDEYVEVPFTVGDIY